MKSTSFWVVGFGLGGVALFTWLLLTGHLSEATYFGSLLVLAFVCVAIPCLPRLLEFDLKNLRMTLSELKQVKAEIETVKADVEQMYGGIENLRKAPLVLDEVKMQELGLKVNGSALARASVGTALVRYTAGCIRRERERLARVFVLPKAPEKLAEAILDNSLDEKVFKWNGPETPLDTPPISVEEREKKKQDQAKPSS